VALRVLIADDNRDAADTLAELVRLWGHEPTVAYDGAAGLRLAAETRPHVLLLDVNMPLLNGYELARQVRRDAGLAGAKLVALSAYSHPDHVRRAEQAGFDTWLVKPAAPDEIERYLAMIDHIKELAEKAQSLAERNAAAAARTEAVAGETKQLLQEVKEDIREVKADVQEIKEELKEVKDKVNGAG
jgi:CheY-like chemotaxis protein